MKKKKQKVYDFHVSGDDIISLKVPEIKEIRIPEECIDMVVLPEGYEIRKIKDDGNLLSK